MDIPTTKDIGFPRPEVRGADRFKPNPQSFSSQAEAFFLANPDEELTIPDACAKFSVTAQTVRTRVHDKRLQKLGLEVVTVIRMKGGR